MNALTISAQNGPWQDPIGRKEKLASEIIQQYRSGDAQIIVRSDKELLYAFPVIDGPPVDTGDYNIEHNQQQPMHDSTNSTDLALNQQMHMVGYFVLHGSLGALPRKV